MLGKGKKKSDLSAYKDHSFIGTEMRLQGDIEFQGGLHLEGFVQGNIRSSDGCLHLHGEVEGDIEVPNAVISGVVRGNVTVSDHLELSPEARIEGTVAYQRMEMSLGAQVSGLLQPIVAPVLKAVKQESAA